MIFFFLSVLFFHTTFTSPVTSFNEEKIKFMKIFNDLILSKKLPSHYYWMPNFYEHFKPLLDLDPVIFLTGMCREWDKVFLFTFWKSYESKYVFLCQNQYNKNGQIEFKDLIAQNTRLFGNVSSACCIFFHFKVYLMRALANYKGDKVRMLIEAENFYKLRLKDLILEVLDGEMYGALLGRLKQMNQDFRFYFSCVELKNLKYLLTKEFHAFKSAEGANEKEAMQIHIGRLAFLAGILKEDRSSIFGLKLISDLSPELIGYFIYMQFNQKEPVNWKIPTSLSDIIRNVLLKSLFEKIPIFKNPSQKFELLEDFTNDYKEFLKDDELIDLTKTLHRKIFLL
jgi:hypothetical protein